MKSTEDLLTKAFFGLPAAWVICLAIASLQPIRLGLFRNGGASPDPARRACPTCRTCRNWGGRLIGASFVAVFLLLLAATEILACAGNGRGVEARGKLTGGCFRLSA